jgi:hypothetical protein
MDYHGPFSADDPVWDAQARLEEKLLKFCYDKTGREPSIGSLRTHLLVAPGGQASIGIRYSGLISSPRVDVGFCCHCHCSAVSLVNFHGKCTKLQSPLSQHQRGRISAIWRPKSA